MHYGERPFVSFIVVEARRDLAALGMLNGARRSAIHTAFDAYDSGPDVIDVEVSPLRQSTLGLVTVTIDHGEGRISVATTSGAVVDASAACSEDVLYASPAAFLEGLLERP